MRVLLMFALLSAPASTQVLNQKLKREHREFRSVLLLPPEVSLQRSGMKGMQGAADEADQVSGALYAAVSQELMARGATILPNPAAGSPSEDAKYALADLQQKLDTISRLLMKKPNGVEKGRYTLGDGVASFRPAASADTLVFLRGSGTLLTNNRQAFQWMTFRPSSSTFSGRIIFVDARSGEVLALSKFWFWRNVANKTEDDLRRGIRDEMHDLPLPTKPK